VFAPEENIAEPEEEQEEQEEEVEKRGRKPARKKQRYRPEDEDDEYEEDEEDERPRRKKSARKSKTDAEDEGEAEGEEEKQSENRDFDPIEPEDEKKRKKKRKRDVSKLSPEERQALSAAFVRASWGCMLLWISFALFMLSMALIVIFYVQAAFPALGASPGYIVASGLFGGIGWVLGAVGLGLALSGPTSPGHWGYGIAAAIATGVHLILLLVLVGKAKEILAGSPVESVAIWSLLPTSQDAVVNYLTVLMYAGEEFVPKGIVALSIIVGIAEILRTTFILLFVSCLAQAAGDKELSQRCTRSAGFTSFGPGFMALGMLTFAFIIIETRAGMTNFSKILLVSVLMSVFVVLGACMLPGFMATRDTADACEEPFQSELPQL
jgi:hypothetical protein